jgi:apolipoprotein N-acyltransferase
LAQALPFFWLAGGGLFSVLWMGGWAVPVAAWVAPVLLLRFLGERRVLADIAWVGMMLYAALWMSYRDVVPVTAAAYAAIIGAYTVALALPYAAHRLMGPRLPGTLATLVFPCTMVAADFAIGRWSPYGTWGSVAYTQSHNLPLVQVVAVTGMAGVTFLMAWFAAIAAWAWRGPRGVSGASAVVLAYALVWGVVVVGGGLRLASIPDDVPSVRVAAIGWPQDIVQEGATGFARALDASLPAPERNRMRAIFARIQQRFLQDTMREARAGSRIVLWPENNAMTFREDEGDFLRRARRVAQDTGVYLLMGMATLQPGAARPLENKAVLFDAAGNLAFSYRKTTVVPVSLEARANQRGDGWIPVSDSPYGRLAAAICFDLDFPPLIRQVGVARADILLVPASEPSASIKRVHQAMAVFRAVENGVSLLRAARWGLYAAVDPHGRIMGEVDGEGAGSRAMVAQLPVTGVYTLYAQIGDVFAWLCVGGLAVLVVFSVWRRAPSAGGLSVRRAWHSALRAPSTSAAVRRRRWLHPRVCHRNPCARPCGRSVPY